MKWNEIIPLLMMVAIFVIVSFVVFWNFYHTGGEPIPPMAKFSGTAYGPAANLTFDHYLGGDEPQEFSVYNKVNLHCNDEYEGVFIVDSNQNGIIEFDWDDHECTARFIDMDGDGRIGIGDHLVLMGEGGFPVNSTYEIYLYSNPDL